MQSKFGLLSPADFDLINGIGFPLEARPDLYQLNQDGTVIFTVKGIQFYKCILSKLDMLPELAFIKTKSDLYKMHCRGLAVLADKTEQNIRIALDSKVIPAHRQDVNHAASYGSLSDFIEAVTRLQLLEGAGPKVIPLNFNKKKPQTSCG